jgi:para-nitrobenzyl esterase
MHAKMREAIGELRSDASYDDLFAAQARAKQAGSKFGLRSGMSFCTEYGHAPLPAEADIDATWRRRAPGLEVLVTWTTDETMFYLNQVPQAQALFRTPVIGPIARRVAVAASSNAVYARGGRRFGRLLARSGATVYEGVFSGRPVGGTLGASHAMETPLLFPNEDVWARAALVAPDGARSLITAGVGMRAAFAGFVRDGRIASRVDLGPGWRGGMRVRRR